MEELKSNQTDKTKNETNAKASECYFYNKTNGTAYGCGVNDALKKRNFERSHIQKYSNFRDKKKFKLPR